MPERSRLETTASTSFSLFIDVDTALLDPASLSVAPVDTLVLDVLYDIHAACDDALALIGGRSIADIDRMVDPLRFPVAGDHGSERRNAQGGVFRRVLSVDPVANLRKALNQLPASLHGIEVEDRTCSVAIHFSQVPHLESLVRLHVARVAAISASAVDIIEGESIIEVRPASCHRMHAIEGFIQEPPFSGRRPILFHADANDSEAIAIVERLGGIAMLVGKSLSACHAFDGPEEIRHWIFTELSIRS